MSGFVMKKQLLRGLLALALLGFGPTSAQIAPIPGLGPFLFASPTCASSTGGTITVAGGYRIHIFNSSGTFTASGSCQIKYLVIAGGGAGGTYCAGGGAGGFLQGTVNIASGAYPITVGLGGTNFNNGGDSLFGSIAHAIGGGAAQGSLNSNGNSGGSGAGGSGFTGNGGSPTAGQGYAGGHGGNDPSFGGGGGGGGAGGKGGDSNGDDGGLSGAGVTSSISGSPVCYAGGGRGGWVSQSGALPGTCGGGNASTGSDANGTPNTGGGAGGRCPTATSAIGGSGIVIVVYQYPPS